MPHRWLWLAAAALAAALLVATPTPAQPAEDRPLAEQPYLGLSVRDSADGPVVAWIAPGPLGGTGYDSAAGIRRSDNLVSINDEPIASAAAFNAAIAALAPGDEVRIVVRRSPEAQPQAAVPKGGPGGEELAFTAILASRDEWTGTIGRGLGERRIAEPAEGEFEAMILDRAAALGVREGDEGIGGGLDALLAHLRRVQENALDPNSLPAVASAFRRPLSLDASNSRSRMVPGRPRRTPAARSTCSTCRSTCHASARAIATPIPCCVESTRRVRCGWSDSITEARLACWRGTRATTTRSAATARRR